MLETSVYSVEYYSADIGIGCTGRWRHVHASRVGVETNRVEVRSRVGVRCRVGVTNV